MRARIWRAAVLRSGMLTALVLALLLGGLLLVVWERGKGNFHRIKSELQTKPAVQVPTVPPPGGQDAVAMERTMVGGGATPEFVSVTLLPGRGMNVLQIMAQIPSLGMVPLLSSPTLDEATKQLNGTGADVNGALSLSLGGAFEVPWAGGLGGVATPDGENVMAVWNGLTLVLPAAPRDSGAAGIALGGLMLKRPATKIQTDVVADGWQNRSVYSVDGFDGHWLSQTEVTTVILLSGRVVDLEVTAKNTGTAPEPMGIGWQPRFAIPSGDRANALLRLPSGMRLEMRPGKEARDAARPTGRLLPISETEDDFTRQGGAKLGERSLNENFVQLKLGLMDLGPVIELRDVTGKFGLRMTALTSTIKDIHVNAPADEPTVTIDPQFNFADPLGKEWDKNQDTGMVVLQPGQSTRWKVRLELFPLTQSTSQF